MPTFALGVLLAGVGGQIWGHVWHGSAPSTYELIGGGAFLAAAMQGPLAGIVLVVELTGHLNSLIVPTLLAVVEATVISRKLGAASIYSARIDLGPLSVVRPAADGATAATIDALDDPALADVRQPPSDGR
jgi:H+/Cl- antiporter ClcA